MLINHVDFCGVIMREGIIKKHSIAKDRDLSLIEIYK